MLLHSWIIIPRPMLRFYGHTTAAKLQLFWVNLLKRQNSSQKTSDIELLKNTNFMISANENSIKSNFFKKPLSYIFSTFKLEQKDIHGCYTTSKGLRTKIGDTNCINILMFFANSANHTISLSEN